LLSRRARITPCPSKTTERALSLGPKPHVAVPASAVGGVRRVSSRRRAPRSRRVRVSHTQPTRDRGLEIA
jgi:hypothetical protein